jgi:hypothetical protein
VLTFLGLNFLAPSMFFSVEDFSFVFFGKIWVSYYECLTVQDTYYKINLLVILAISTGLWASYYSFYKTYPLSTKGFLRPNFLSFVAISSPIYLDPV